MNETYKQIIENYIHSYNSFDVEGMLKDLHQEVVFENISDGQVNVSLKGIDAFKKQAEAARAYFSQREQRIKAWVFRDEAVSIDIEYRGRLAMDLPNGAKAGETIQLKGQSVFEFKEGQISRIQDIS
jgi:hypothetical protein